MCAAERSPAADRETVGGLRARLGLSTVGRLPSLEELHRRVDPQHEPDPHKRLEASIAVSEHYRQQRAERSSDVAEAPGDGQAPTDRLRSRLHVGAAVCSLPALRPLVAGLLFLPGESVVYAPPKACKTFFTLHLALSVAAGRPFMGRPVAQGKVLYIAAEGVGGLGARVHAWREYHHVDDLDGAAFLTTAVNLFDPGAVTALCELLDEWEPTLTVVDTLARCSTGADENSARDMGRVVDSIDTIRDRTGGHVANVHHAGKDTTKGMRGSTALLGAVDTVIKLSGDTQALKVEVTDQKDTEPLSPWWCRLTPAGGSAVIELCADSDIFTGAQVTVLEALSALPAEDRTASKWQAMAEDFGVARRTFFEAKKQLLIRGRVTGDGGRGALYHPAEDDPR
ncbi:MAG: AAA family ATPase [Acidimicrobiia bacterium]